MKRMYRWLSLLLVLALVLALAGCGSRPEDEEPEVPTLNITLSLDMPGQSLEGQFSPFYARSIDDHTIVELTQLQLLPSDRAGMPVLQGIEGETRPYNGTDYTYYGPANLEMTENEDGTVWYDITLRDDLTFSDGEPVTVDDLIFSLYVLCDPAYNGPSILGEMPIQGLEEYQADYIRLSALLYQLGEDNTDFSQVTQEEQDAFWAAVDGPLTEFAQAMLDLNQAQAEWDATLEVGEARLIYTPAYLAELFEWGALPEDATARDLGILMAEHFGWDFEQIDHWRTGTSYVSLSPLSERLGEVYGYSSRYCFMGEEEIRQIAGIQQTGENIVRVVADRVDVRLLYTLGAVCLAPLHHYGETELYAPEEGSFGFPKGDLSGVKAQNGTPLGAGPYRLVSYEDRTVTCQANEGYYLGAPKIPQLQLSPYSEQALEKLESGAVDLCLLSSSTGVSEIEGIERIPVAGRREINYVFLGINPLLVNVAGDPGSEASKNLRKGFATVIAACRQPGLEQELELGIDNQTWIIDLPVSQNTWLTPGREDGLYQEAYSWDIDGNPIYTADMTQEERLDAALQAALGYFAAAGCTVEGGRVTAPPAGTELSYEMTFYAEEDTAQLLAMQMASEALAEIGVELTVTNIPWEQLVETQEERLEDEEQPFYAASRSGSDCWDWCAIYYEWKEWYLAADPDACFYPLYSSAAEENAEIRYGEESALFGLEDPELDQLLLEARSTLDPVRRTELYQQCLERIFDWGCEVPYYQPHDQLLYNSARVDAASLPSDMTAYYGWVQGIQNLKLSTSEEELS